MSLQVFSYFSGGDGFRLFFVTAVLLELSHVFYYKDFKYTCEPRIPVITSSHLINDHRLQCV